jgi:hypothetical protein
MATPKSAYIAKMRLLSHLRNVGDLTPEDEDAILDEMDELWDACSESERKDIRDMKWGDWDEG